MKVHFRIFLLNGTNQPFNFYHNTVQLSVLHKPDSLLAVHKKTIYCTIYMDIRWDYVFIVNLRNFFFDQ